MKYNVFWGRCGSSMCLSGGKICLLLPPPLQVFRLGVKSPDPGGHCFSQKFVLGEKTLVDYFLVE